MRKPELALALLLAHAGFGCKSEIDELVESERRRGGGSEVPGQFVGTGTDPATGLPIGYPPSLPMIAGARAISGGVDPGVVRTATLVIDGRTVEQVETELRAALAARNARVVNEFAPPDGSTQLRIDLGDQYATVILSDDHGRVRMDTTAIDRRTPRR